MKILLAEDSKSIRGFVRRVLEENGFQLEAVEDGAQALDRYRKGRFDFVIMDWEMPRMDGPAAVRSLREMGCTLPIMMMTSRIAQDDIRFMLTHGADEYLMKPFTAEVLIEKIRMLMGQRHAS